MSSVGMFGLCCCNPCSLGAVIPRWHNHTTVRRTVGGVPTAGNAPFPRYDGATYDGVRKSPDCAYAQRGECGTWLASGGLNAPPAMGVTDGVNDIEACQPDDSTHAKVDRNCYEQSGTMDMRVSRLTGGQWVLGRKMWHGTFGFKDQCDPHLINGVTCQTGLVNYGAGYFETTQGFNTSAPQIKYRRATTSCATHYEVDNPDPTPDYAYTGSSDSSVTVNELSGVISKEQDNTTNYPTGTDPAIGGTGITLDDNGDIFSFLIQSNWNSAVLSFTHFYLISTGPVLTAHVVSAGSGVWELRSGDSPDVMMERITIDLANGHFERYIPVSTYSAAEKTQEMTISNTRIDYAFTLVGFPGIFPTDESNSGSIILDLPYTAQDCYQHWRALMALWDMSDLTLARLRADEQLGNMPLMIYDEKAASNPLPYVWSTMDDYNSPVADANGTAPWTSTDPGAVLPWVYNPAATQDWILTWEQIPWQDPSNYVWKYGDSYLWPSGVSWPTCTLISGLYTGTPISHTRAGSERHFWFGAHNYVRDYNSSGTPWYVWNPDSYGAFSSDPLPAVTLRWLDRSQAQYDPESVVTGPVPPGLWPQAWLHQAAGALTGAKYIEAAKQWPAVNYGRPCGEDRFAVDQQTVCCVTTSDEASFTVAVTGEALAPGSAGGIAVDDYILVEDVGTFKVTRIKDLGGSYLIEVSALLDAYPAGHDFQDPDQIGDGGTHLGRLRWPSASGICGRAAITTAHDSGTNTLTITPASALPWLRPDPATGEIRVDIYDSSMTLLEPDVSLTRISQTNFTSVRAALPTAAWMTGHGVDWTHYDAAPRRTAIHLEWTFNPRATDPDYPSPPAWYAAVPGCLSMTITQFSYTYHRCGTVLGIAPHYDPLIDAGMGLIPSGSTLLPGRGAVEAFQTQIIFPFPDTFAFDDIHTSHWQSAVETVMPDPYWERPYKPDCDADPFVWQEDNGDGVAEYFEDPNFYRQFAHRPWVEAAKDIPAGRALPDGVDLYFSAEIAPPYYPNGLPIGDAEGNYLSVERPWGFAGRACDTISAVRPFAGFYQGFVTC